MDGLQLSDLGNMLSRLSENPNALNALSGLLGNLSAPPKKEPPKSDSDDILSFFSSLSNLRGGGNEQSSGAPKQAQETHAQGFPQIESASPKREQNNPLSSIFGTREEIKNRILLLNALRPYLSESRRDRLEMVIKLLKLTELGELSSLLNRP